MQKKLFSELGLSPEILKAVEKMGFEEASPIQSEAIPPLLTGADVVGQSQTGSGKTAAFAIPAIEKVDGTLRAPQVLILCPTRELAVQVAEEVSKLALFKRGVRELPIYGGQSYERQFRGLKEGAQIIIGTPGRVMDHLDRKSLKLDQLRMVILDEADRMLDMGFREDIETILKQAPVERQTVFFSATLPKPITDLIKHFTKNPVSVRIEAQQMTVLSIDQVYYEVERRFKLEALCRIIDLQDVKLGIVFCATKMMVDELTEHLIARGYQADKLHGDMTQAMRERVMNRFRQRKVEFLVATDVAARGLDVEDIEVVFNYDLPHDGEDYVHRIGRTGRAGKNGRAITFVAGREIYKLQNISRFTKAKIRREKVPSIDEVEEKRGNQLFDSLKETLEKNDFKRQDVLVDRLLDAGHSPTDIASALLHLLTPEKPKAEQIPDPAAPREYPRYESRGGGGNTGRGARPERRSSERPARDYAEPKRTTARARPEASSTSHEEGMVRLAFNVGRDHEIMPGDLVGVIAGVTRLPREMIGRIDLEPTRSLVDVAAEHAGRVLKKLNGIQVKGHKLSVEIPK
ncbi:MAG TPA: DEAD/DEAH box helicase [Chthoniobacteraceae bacterium]